MSRMRAILFSAGASVAGVWAGLSLPKVSSSPSAPINSEASTGATVPRFAVPEHAGQTPHGETVEALVAAFHEAVSARNIPGALAVLKRLANSDGYQAVKLFQSFKVLREEYDKWHRSHEDLMKHFSSSADAEGMMRAFLEDPKWWRDTLMVESIFGAMARRDPERAWSILIAPGRNFDFRGGGSIGEAWAKQNPRQALEFIARQAPSSARSDFIKAASQHWGSSALGDFLAWWSAVPDRFLWEDDIAWLKMPPTSAAELAALLSAMPERLLHSEGAPLGLDDIFRHGEHMESHGEWIRALPEGAMKDYATRAYVLKLLETRPEEALEWHDLVRDREVQRSITSTIAAMRALDAPADGIAYALSLADARARQAALESVTETWAGFDRVNALNAIVGHPEWKITWGNMVIEWARSDPLSASEFALANSRTDWCLHGTLRNWLDSAPEAAAAWVDALPDGPSRQRAIEGMALGAARIDGPAAMQWAQALSDAKRRQDTLASCLRRWAEDDLGAAAEWLQYASLDAATAQRLGETLAKAKK